MIVKLSDGKPHRMSRREVVLTYMFDGFQSVDTFMVIETNHAKFDCILGMPWLAQYQPKINWLARSVKRRGDFDVSEVFKHLLVSSSDCPHVTVVDQLSTTQSMHSGLPYANEMTVEQGLPHVMKVTVEQGLPSASKTSVGRGSRTRRLNVGSRTTIRPVQSTNNLLHLDEGHEIEQICLITDADSVSPMVDATSASTDISARPKSAKPKSAQEERFETQSWDALCESDNPPYETAHEFADIFPDKIPAELPADRGVHHEIDLAPGTKYCVTRQWPLPRDQVKAIDDFFENRRQAGHVRESISPHSSPIFCVKKATGGWRIVHVFNKINDATIPV
ncbi:polyprotein [Phytophthora megakarya]|uniref:Polyprotein n=1 Tax=Phytophthora megakarya TaxID=4795 RepID=A0A225ULA6_9STRA|nr:polyprotein [Phytophthora megakarya]